MVLPIKKDKIKEKNKKKNVLNKIVNSKRNKNPTHLYYHDKYLTNIKILQSFELLTVLYLHNNLINKIENLEAATNLVSLYLQKNKIQKIENLDKLINLRKLYLDHNEISVVENLEKLINLEELYLEKQNLFNGDSLCFEPRTIHALSYKLQILNIASNNIHSIEILSPLQHIIKLNASNNNITNINEVCLCIKNWNYLKEAWFIGNPISKGHRYREDIIGSSVKITMLDNKEIKEVTRCFIKRFEQERTLRGSKQNTNIMNEIASLNLPNNYAPPIQKAVYNYILHPNKSDSALSKESINNDYSYIPWNSMPKTNTKIPLVIKNQKKTMQKKELRFNCTDSLFPNIFK